VLQALLIDYNGFFAACEQQDRPELRGRAVAVIPVRSEHTSCIAANYAAKGAGIKVGTPVAEARRLCPGIAIVESRPERYLFYHKKLIEAVETCLPVAEVWSIDEVWCRLPVGQHEPGAALELARRVKSAIARIAGVADLLHRPRAQCVVGQDRVGHAKAGRPRGDRAGRPARQIVWARAA
jgi:DNA polymerase IV